MQVITCYIVNNLQFRFKKMSLILNFGAKTRNCRFESEKQIALLLTQCSSSFASRYVEVSLGGPNKVRSSFIGFVARSIDVFLLCEYIKL